MANQWFKLRDLLRTPKACPLSIGQAELARYTFCVGDQCMAWKWLTDDLLSSKIEVDEEIPDGYQAASEPFYENNKKVIKIMQMPIFGRCGMVPRDDG